MSDILTLADARLALGWSAPFTNAAANTDLAELYVPAVVELFESNLTVPDPTPAVVRILARRILARLWNADHQGTGGERPSGTPASPARFTDEDLLMAAPWLTLGGFA